MENLCENHGLLVTDGSLSTIKYCDFPEKFRTDKMFSLFGSDKALRSEFQTFADQNLKGTTIKVISHRYDTNNVKWIAYEKVPKITFPDEPIINSNDLNHPPKIEYNFASEQAFNNFCKLSGIVKEEIADENVKKEKSITCTLP